MIQTIEKLYNANSSLYNSIFTKNVLDDQIVEILIIELRIITCFLFEKYFFKLQIDTNIKKDIIKRNFYIEESRIITPNNVITYEMLNEICLKIKEEIEKEKLKKIIYFTPKKKMDENKIYNTEIIMDIHKMIERDKNISKKIAKKTLESSTKLDKISFNYLKDIKNEFLYTSYETIENILYELNENKRLKNPISPNNIVMLTLLKIFPFFIYGYDKIEVDYNTLDLDYKVLIKKNIYEEKKKHTNNKIIDFKTKKQDLIRKRIADEYLELYEQIYSKEYINKLIIEKMIYSYLNHTIEIMDDEVTFYSIKDYGSDFIITTNMTNLFSLIEPYEMCMLKKSVQNKILTLH